MDFGVGDEAARGLGNRFGGAAMAGAGGDVADQESDRFTLARET